MNKTFRNTLLLSITLCILSISSIKAQVTTKGTSNFYFGYGAPNLPALIVADWGENGSKGVGPYTFAYTYNVSRLFAIGGQVGYVGAVSNPTAWESTSGSSSQTVYYSMDMHIFTLMVKADMHYRKRGSRGDFYGTVAAGYGFLKVGISGHADPNKEELKISGLVYSVAYGYRFMVTDNIGLFAEGGYGLMGFATAGISIKAGGAKKNWWDRH